MATTLDRSPSGRVTVSVWWRETDNRPSIHAQLIARTANAITWEDPDEMPTRGERPGPNGGRVLTTDVRNAYRVAEIREPA
jgi:hypothetical protein